MQIVIDIDEESYEHIKKYANEEVLPVGWYAIINGTPLPEHHGRLIDADKLNIYDVSPADGFVVMGVTEEDIDLAPTIIEGSESK